MGTRLLACIVFTMTFLSPSAFACTCVPPPREAKTPRDIARWHAERSDAIFEGTVQSVELKWQLLQARVGSLISCDFDDDAPALQVTFNVSRSYKGASKRTLVLTTGLGGGDCGFGFQIGQQYLVYAYRGGTGQLSSGICSGTAPLRESQSDISFLRGEAPGSEKPVQMASASTSKLCGHVVSKTAELADSQVFLFSVVGQSPIPAEDSDLASDGSFCFTGVNPGSYRLAFLSGMEDSPVSFAFYPGTANPSSQSSILDLGSGQTVRGLNFKIPPQPTFFVQGSISTSNKAALPSESKVFLVNADLSAFLVSYSHDIEADGSFRFARVLPGRYWAVVGIDSDSASNWETRKTEVNVNAQVSGLFLELVRK